MSSGATLIDLVPVFAIILKRKRKLVAFLVLSYRCTVKPVLCGLLKIDKTTVLMENGSLMKVESIAECSHFGVLFEWPFKTSFTVFLL